MTTLVIGYGNEARGDDGAGPEVARRVEALQLLEVEVLILHQLVPELSERLAKVDQAIFVDASCAEQDTPARMEQIAASEEHRSGNHHWTPASLLQLSAMLFGRAPHAWLLAIAGRDFEPGEALSDMASLGIRHAVILLEGLLDVRPKVEPGTRNLWR